MNGKMDRITLTQNRRQPNNVHYHRFKYKFNYIGQDVSYRLYDIAYCDMDHMQTKFRENSKFST